MRLGAHVSTAGGVHNAVAAGLDLGCEAIQVFTRNQRQWRPRPLDEDDVAAFRAAAKKAGYLATAVSHASYLINLCATDPAILDKSRTAFVDEIERCAALGIPHLCVHPGAHVGAGEEAGLKGVAASVKEALKATRGKRVRILLENTAGQGTTLGARLEHLAELMQRIGSKRIGVCLDTCHLFAAGYDLRTKRACKATMEKSIAVLGLDAIRAFHLNDSRHPLGSRRDRHAHIGEGEIGKAGFRALVRDARFAERPGLLETPDGTEGYRANLARLRKMRT